MKPTKTNMVKKRLKQREPVAGDIFRIEMSGGQVVEGRVVATNVVVLGFSDGVLTYIFKPNSRGHTIHDLLLAPFLASPDLWSKGYFETIETRPFAADERHGSHCFWDSMGNVFDEAGNKLSVKSDPCLHRAIALLGAVDDKISAALNIPLAGQH